MAQIKYYVQLVGGPPCEKKFLQDSLTIGTETEGLQLNHPHLSPEHCTLFLQNGVLSIIDHNSDHGVTINGKRIPPNKMIILLPSDEIKLGHLWVKLFKVEEESEAKTQVLNLKDLIKENSENKDHQVEQSIKIAEISNSNSNKTTPGPAPDLLDALKEDFPPSIKEESLTLEQEAEVTQLLAQENSLVTPDININLDDHLGPISSSSNVPKTHEKKEEGKAHLSMQSDEDWTFSTDSQLQVDATNNTDHPSENNAAGSAQMVPAQTSSSLDLSADDNLDDSDWKMTNNSSKVSTTATTQSVDATKVLMPDDNNIDLQKSALGADAASGHHKSADQQSKSPINKATDAATATKVLDSSEEEGQLFEEKTGITIVKQGAVPSANPNTLKLKKKPAKKVQKNVKELLKRNKEKTRQYYFNQVLSVGFFVRILAFIIDLIIGTKVSLLIWETGMFANFLQYMQEFASFSLDFIFSFHPRLNFLTEDIPFVAPLLAGYLLVRVVSNLIFGLSPGQLLLLCKPNGNFIINRIFGPIRELMGFMLAPLLIFDIPALFGRKTVKEMLTMTGLQNYSNKISYVMGIILIPLLYVFCFLTPMQEIMVEQKPLIQQNSLLLVANNQSGNAADQVQYASSYFYALQMPIVAPFYLSYPSFRVAKNGNSKIYIPNVSIYQKEKKIHLKWERVTPVDWRELISETLKRAPYISNRFPELLKFVNGEKVNQLQFVVDLKTLIDTSINLSWENLLWHTLRYGPSLEPFVYFKNNFLSIWRENVESISYLRIGKREYLKADLANISNVKNAWTSFKLLPISSARSYVYLVKMKSEKKIEAFQYLKEKFYPLLKHQGQIKNSILLSPPYTLDALNVIDFFTLKHFSPELLQKFIPLMQNYYYQLGKNTCTSDDESLRKDIDSTMEQTLSMLADLNQELKKSSDFAGQVIFEDLIKKLSEILVAYRAKQQSYFAL